MTRVIVVGAGMGGLAAAFDLSARGADVTVVEQHATPGGKMRQVNIDGHLLDAGPTVFTMRWIFDDLFSDAGLNFADHVGLHRADLLARHAWLDGTRLDLYTDIETSMAAIETAFSTADAEAYRDFTDAAGRIFATLDQSFMRAQKPSPVGLAGRLGLTGIPALLATKPFATLWQDLCARFPDQRLAQLFARYSTYCGSSPFAAPATLQLIAHAERMGVWYLDGGMHSLAQAMAGLIEQHGGTLRYGAPVSELLSYDGRITGVVLEDGEALTADAVIFNGDNAALAEGLLGEGARSGVSPLPKDRDSLSAVTWNVVGNVSGFPLAHHTVLFGDDYPGEFAAVFDHRTVVKHPTVYICAQDRRDDEPGPAEERLLLLINAPA
ncbi:MAG: FAD-dependent oxidoreductase, partial [Pseudomonadota bacterium]